MLQPRKKDDKGSGERERIFRGANKQGKASVALIVIGVLPPFFFPLLLCPFLESVLESMASSSCCLGHSLSRAPGGQQETAQDRKPKKGNQKRRFSITTQVRISSSISPIPSSFFFPPRPPPPPPPPLLHMQQAGKKNQK